MWQEQAAQGRGGVSGSGERLQKGTGPALLAKDKGEGLRGETVRATAGTEQEMGTEAERSLEQSRRRLEQRGRRLEQEQGGPGVLLAAATTSRESVQRVEEGVTRGAAEGVPSGCPLESERWEAYVSGVEAGTAEGCRSGHPGALSWTHRDCGVPVTAPWRVWQFRVRLERFGQNRVRLALEAGAWR